MGGPSPSGDIFVPEDLPGIIAAGHEIGCHTYGHLPAWGTPTRIFEQSVLRNGAAMAEVVPGGRLRTHSYPLCEPRPGIKRAAGRLPGRRADRQCGDTRPEPPEVLLHRR
jgi:peptidoglycan/xylan/chitin deacetylase (PgdA/CDA1 family)